MSNFAFKSDDYAFRKGGPRHLLEVHEAWEKEAHDHPEAFTPGSHALLRRRRPQAFRAVQNEQVKDFDHGQ